MALSAPKNISIIGVGGTGKKILTYLKQSLIQANNQWLMDNSPLKSLDPDYGKAVPEGIKFLCLDLDNDKVEIDDVTLDYDENTSDEFINFKAVLSDIKEKVSSQNDPRWPWLESEDASKLTISIGGDESQGAGQQRQFSHLSLLESLRAQKISKTLNSHIQYFSQRCGADATLTNNFIIVGSIAGGTGSGTVLDIAQLVKYHVFNRPLGNSYIIGIKVLSEAFNETFRTKPSQWHLVQANCLAALREIRRFLVLLDGGYTFPEYDYCWNPSPKLTDRTSPFDVLYLADGTRPEGANLKDFPPEKTIYPAIADYLLSFCIQNQRPFDPTNTRNIISQTSDGVFSTLGCHNWILPVDDIIKDFSFQLGLSYMGDIKKSVSPIYDWDRKITDFLRKNEDYYSQNSPQNEYFLGATVQTEKFGLLYQVANLIADKEINNIAPLLDFNFFTEKIYSPQNYPLRFVDPGINTNLTLGCELPSLNLDSSRVNESDFFKSNPDIGSTNDQNQVINLAKKLMSNNIGTSTDPIYDKSNRQSKRTYHSILKYYQKTAVEIFGGYQDHKGNYYPGLLENQLFLILNRVKQSTPLIDRSTGKEIKGQYIGNPLLDVSYELNDCPLSTAKLFCEKLQLEFEKVKGIIDEAYQQQMYQNGVKQDEIDMEEALRREYDYLNAGKLTAFFKKSPYLESMQRWLFSQRLVVMKRTLMAILEDFIEIIKGWTEAIGKNFEAEITALESQLNRNYSDFCNERIKNESIQTRTYISRCKSHFEQSLYQKYIEAATQQLVRDGNKINISNREMYYASSYVNIGPKATDVDTRPGMKRSGRELKIQFRYVSQGGLIREDVLTLPQIATKYALHFCQGVRNVNFWEALTQYKDANNNSRYQIDAQGLPSLLTSDIVSNSNSFINYAPGQIVGKIAGTNDKDFVVYADWPDVKSTFNQSSFQNTLTSRQFTNLFNANVPAGQKYRLSAIRQINNLTIESLHSFRDNLGYYRDWLHHTYILNAQKSAGTPLHIFLGEKNGSAYEGFLIDHWQNLDLTNPVRPDFFFPLEVILALENEEAVKDFLWAGIHMKKLYWAYSKSFSDHLAIMDMSSKLIPLTNSSKKGFLKALLFFIKPDDTIKHQLDIVKRDIRQNREDFLDLKNKDRVQFESILKGYLTYPINQMILQSGVKSATPQKIIASPTTDPNLMSDEEKLNLLFRAFIYKDLS